MHAVARINAALALIGQSGVAVTLLSSSVGTATAPNGGTAANLEDGSASTTVATTTPIGVVNPYVVGAIDMTALTQVAYVDVVKLSLSAGSSRGEFCLQHSLDGIVWHQCSEFFTVTTDTSNSRRINVAMETRHFRVARVGATDMTTATAVLAGLDIYIFGSNDKDVTVARLYGRVRDAVLAMHPWTVTKRKIALTASAAADAPLTEWTESYELPEYLLAGPRAVFESVDDRAPSKDWELYHGRLYTDLATVYIDYQVRAEEETWPPWLRLLVDYAAAAEFAEPITDQTSKADAMKEMTYGPPAADGKGGYFRTARNLDSVNKPSEGFKDFSLVEARF